MLRTHNWDDWAGPAPHPADFGRAAELLRQRAGIVLAGHKREMVERRLGLRAMALGLTTLTAYLDVLASDAAHPEWESFVNGFTINHTAFFRERHHFDILASHARDRRHPLSVWCCAASTGEEAYSIAMTLAELHRPGADASHILATDIDTKALAVAKAGIYALDRSAAVPAAYLQRYFQRGAGPQAGKVRIKTALREQIRFEPLNLLDSSWPSGPFDAVFCRNTMIYFDKPTQTRLLERFARVLKEDGLLFAGHSENFTYLTRTLKLRGQTVYVLA